MNRPPPAIMPTKTPLILISGFLGAGKTTFLRQLLPLLGERELRPHLVINDYGEAEIDAAALAQLAASVRAINGSCVCCESQDEFLNLLQDEALDEKSVLLVETNGTTDPYEIIEALGLDLRARRYGSPLHVSIIDVQRWQKRWWHNELERLQIRSAGYHYVSKTDATPTPRVERVTEELRGINPDAKRVSPALLADDIAGLPLEDLTEADGASMPKHKHQHAEELHDPAHSHGEHHHAAHQFVSMQIPLPASIMRDRMAAWLQSLPREVIRAKGFVRLEESPDRLYSFQKVEDSQEITFLPLSAEFARAPLALLIGAGIDQSAIPAL